MIYALGHTAGKPPGIVLVLDMYDAYKLVQGGEVIEAQPEEHSQLPIVQVLYEKLPEHGFRRLRMESPSAEVNEMGRLRLDARGKGPVSGNVEATELDGPRRGDLVVCREYTLTPGMMAVVLEVEGQTLTLGLANGLSADMDSADVLGVNLPGSSAVANFAEWLKRSSDL